MNILKMLETSISNHTTHKMRMLDFPARKHFIFSQPFGAKSVTNPAAGHLRQRLASGPYVHEAEAALDRAA